MITRISRYEVQAELGRGAFTRVFRAWDPAGSRLVAIKTPAEQSEKGLFVYLQNEASVLFRLQHPNIVSIYEWGEHAGTPFIALEYLEGKTLRQAITDASLSIVQKMDIMRQVGQALECAHRSGTVHLDIRPPNIMLLPNGPVKILDFGGVQLTEESAARLARDGYLRASLMYAAPEQISSAEETSDTSSDIFAYGIIYYELLTGKYPFAAADEKELLSKILNESPAGVRSLAPDCPKALARVVHRTLQKDPKLRYQSVEELQSEVEPILAELRGPQPKSEQKREPSLKLSQIPWRRWAAVGVPALCLVAAAGVLAPRFSHKAPSPPVAAAAAQPGKPEPPPAEAQPSQPANQSRPSPLPPVARPAPPPAPISGTSNGTAPGVAPPQDAEKKSAQEVAKAAPQQFDPSALLRPKPAPAAPAIRPEDLGPPPDAPVTPSSVPSAVPVASAIARAVAPPVSAPERIRLGGNFQEPKLISGPPPQMPPIAKDRRVYGVVKLEATITKEGAVKDVKIVSGPPLLTSAAKEAAAQRRYSPATLNGDPVEVKLPIQIVFQPGR